MKKITYTANHRTFPILIEKDESWFIAHNLTIDVASQGKSLEEAIANIKEATQLYMDDTDTKTIQPHDYFLTSVSV